ncbi:MAG: maleate cis-trans isomerase [Gammaproteobacteria bacterium]|nr:maleate cis-trans isomerase [Gammaproteobacteria bacterium]
MTTLSLPVRLAFLYPPNGSEYEYYLFAEHHPERYRTYVVGVRVAGGDDEHNPEHLRCTARIDNLELAADMVLPLKPDVTMWACTSGSFINGVEHARRQAEAIGQRLGCPASSTSLAFVSALSQLGIKRVGVLASYPEATAMAFSGFLEEIGVAVEELECLDAPSGPHAARLGETYLIDAASKLYIPENGALLIPDTAMPTLGIIDRLERGLNTTVLTANQVTIWEALRLADVDHKDASMGKLFATPAFAESA